MSLLTIETQEHKVAFGDKIDISDLDSLTKTEEITAISIAPNASKEYYEEIKEFLQKCNDNIRISNTEVFVGDCSIDDFYKGEEIINSIIEKIDPSWTDLQKTAYVHYEMGKHISYYPDFNLLSRNINTTDGINLMNEVNNDCRNIWKQFRTGKGVCNGIVDINRTILSRLGIKTKALQSRTHTFLLTETDEGNIITDPTWDLEYTLYDLRPAYFGLSYEELRQRDGDISGAHKLENPPENIRTISDNELRKIYLSIGKTDREGLFGQELMDEINKIKNMQFNDDYEKYCYTLQQFPKLSSDRLKNLSENKKMIEIMLYSLGFDIEKFKTYFIYEKSDKLCKNPILSILFEDFKGEAHSSLLNQEKKTFENIELGKLDEKYNVHVCDTKDASWKKYINREQNNQEKQSEITK